MRWTCALLVCVLGGVAHADGLGPKRASEIVDLTAVPNTPCPFLGLNSIVFNTRVLANGATQGFTLPAGQVLVVTGVTLTGAGATPGTGIQSRLYKGSLVGSQTFARRDTITDGAGRFEHQYDLASGSVVARDAVVCAELSLPNAGTFGHLSGFLAKDR
jgi:hypothetical protein